MSEAVPQIVPQAATKAAPEPVPQAVPQTAPQAAPQVASQTKLARRLTVDFPRVKKLNPHLYQFEELLGGLLQLASLGGGAILLLGLISRGRLELGWETFLLGYCVHIFIYSKYLLRDKNKYQSNSEHAELRRISSLDSGKAIQVDDYFDRELTSIVSDLLDLQTDKPFMYLGPRVFSSRSVLPLAKRIGLEVKSLEQLSSSWLAKYDSPSIASQQTLAESLLQAFTIAHSCHFKYFGVEALFLVLLENYIPEAARSLGVEGGSLKALSSWVKTKHEKEAFLERVLREQLVSPLTKVNSSMTSIYAPTVEIYCRDLSFAISRKLRRQRRNTDVHLSMREEQLTQLVSVLTTDEAMALITGPAGAGKSTLVSSLALRILAELVPESLLEKRLMELNVSKLLGLDNPAEITVLMQQIFSELKRAGNIILFIDDLDQLLSIREDLRGELTAMLAAQLREVEIKLVATVTDGSYERYLRQLPELSSLFTVIPLGEASRGLTEQILLDELPELERKYKVTADFAAINRLVEFSQKTDLIKVLPDKALDNLRTCLRETNRAGLRQLSVRQVEDFFAQKTGAPLSFPQSEVEREKIINLGQLLSERVIGQQEAVRQVATVLQKARAGLSSAHKPQASFLFYGPTGVGKTHLAQTITDLYYGKHELMLRLDMSEFQEDENLVRLLGKVSGNNYQEGILTGFVLKNPFSLVLLDEIEKANPKVLDLFLQVLDNAAILNGKGQKVDFSGCVVVATSNAGSREIAQGMLAGRSYKEVKPLAEQQLHREFKLEFLNRFDAVTMFAPLMPVHAEEIVRKLLWQKKQELAQKGIEFVFDDNLASRIAQEGFDQTYGARSLKRAVAQKVDGQLAELLLSGKLKSGDVFQL